jgi:DNA-3-methyladenine glycosylase II
MYAEPPPMMAMRSGVLIGDNLAMLPLPVDPPYDFDLSTFRFRRFGDDLASRWHAGGLHRVLASGLAVRIEAGGVRTYGGATDADVDEIGHLLGARFDLGAFAAAHPDVYARAPGFRPPLLSDPFEMLVTAVTAQQISLRAAAVIRAGLVRRHGERVEHDGVEWWRFPSQERIRGADLTGLKLSAMKMRSIAALAEADLDLAALGDEDVVARLSLLPGIGRWTAEWFLARCLGRPGVVAAGDLGVRKAVARWFSQDAIWPERRVRDAMGPFGDQANLAAHYLLLPTGG